VSATLPRRSVAAPERQNTPVTLAKAHDVLCHERPSRDASPTNTDLDGEDC
jgi:hypothetical protein